MEPSRRKIECAGGTWLSFYRWEAMKDPISEFLDKEIARIRARKHQTPPPPKRTEAQSELQALHTVKGRRESQPVSSVAEQGNGLRR